MRRRDWMAMAGGGAMAATKRPNILWISCEDASPLLGCYGDRLAKTPHLDRLAAEGTVYTRAFSVAGVCAPSRSGIITGVHPTSLNSHHMRCETTLPAGVRCFPEYLREAGYYCTNNAKTDYNFKVPRSAWDQNDGKAHWRGRAHGQPFFSVFNLEVTHESRLQMNDAEFAEVTESLGAAQRCDPAQVTLPPYYPDTPTVRRQWARFYEVMTVMDGQAGALLQQLESDGLKEETIVFFWGDHGIGLPRAKRWLYESGTRCPLVVRLPRSDRGRKQVARDAQLVSLLDLGPTILAAAGVSRPAHMQGRNFLASSKDARRNYIYGHRDRMDERYDVIRSVRDARYRYVRNYDAWRPWAQPIRTAEQSPVMQEWRRAHAAGELNPVAARFFAAQKPTEELYDAERDPHEVNNLAQQQRYADVLQRMRAEHQRWVLATKDNGLLPEAELLKTTLTNDERMALMQLIAAGEAGKAATLREALQHAHPAFRYRAAMHLGNGRQSEDRTALERMSSDDPSAAVRIAATRGALLCGGERSNALSTLLRELAGSEEWARLQAVLELDEMLLQAAELETANSALLLATKDSNNYVTRVAGRLLNRKRALTPA
jgi:N-sulfoglucosamine sulfohydrolase